MAKPIPKKLTNRPVSGKPRAESRVWIGIDLSLHTLALAGLGYDKLLDKMRGPSFFVTRWNKHDHYFLRLKEASKAHELISEVLTDMKMIIELDQIYIYQEEPWPMGLVGKGNSQTLKQQAEMSGALLSGLVRYGYQNVYQINSKTWQKMVADDLGITTHYSKWGKGLEGKMRPKQWALSGDSFAEFPNSVPEWPDLIADSKDGGRIPQPASSKAKPLQPDDRYDALALAHWGYREIGLA